MELDRSLEELESMVASEIDKLTKRPELNPAEIKSATDAVCLLEKIQKVKQVFDEDDEYSERRGSYRSARHYMMDRGYSRHSINDRIVDKLEHMMDDAGSEYERSVIASWIARVKSE